MIGVVGRGKLRQLRVMWRGKAFFTLWKSPPTYASTAEATTCISIIHCLWIGPFSGGMRCGSFLGLAGLKLRWYLPPVWLILHGSERYDASLSMWSNI